MANKDGTTLQSYLQFCVPLRVTRSKWYLGLKASLGGVRGVNWHSEKSFHITAAFIKNLSGPDEGARVVSLLDEDLKGLPSMDITFDTVVAFTGTGGDKHYVCLSATEPAPVLTEVIGKIRANLEAHGYSLGPYRFHVTLAEIPVGNIGLKELQARVGSVSVPTFSLTLTKADYRFKGAKTAVRPWTLPIGSPPLPTVSHRPDHHQRKRG